MAQQKLKAAILGFGGIGHFHATNYIGQQDVELVAVADMVPEQLEVAVAEINLGSSGESNLGALRKYTSYEALIKNERLDFIDICVPTDLHSKYAVKALKAGLPVLSEKPMGRTLAQADAMIRASEASGNLLMIGQCLRFWPCYEALKAAYDGRKYGRLLRLSMTRNSGLPHGRDNWFRDGKRSGGALLDMHIHDTDFVNHLLGVPDAVATFGCTHYTGAIDDAVTNYIYEGGPLVSAETSWSHGAFSMGFTAVFEDATLQVTGEVTKMTIFRLDQEPEVVSLCEEGGHFREIAYFAKCVRQNRVPQLCDPVSTRETIRIALAEERSARNGGRRVAL